MGNNIVSSSTWERRTNGGTPKVGALVMDEETGTVGKVVSVNGRDKIATIATLGGRFREVAPKRLLRKVEVSK